MFGMHPSLPDDLDDAASLWRYVDLARYADLLQTSELHFARADSMADTWEGSYSPLNLTQRPEAYGDVWPMMERTGTFQRIYEYSRTHVFLNCWHASDVESAAMWEIYDREQRGVAIRSTHGRIRAALADSNNSVYGSSVRYIDYNTEPVPEGNIFAPYRHKRTSFAHEREFRLITSFLPPPRETDGSDGVALPENFMDPIIIPPSYVREHVDLGTLVEEVRISPEAPSWFAGVVERLTRTYGGGWPVTSSDMATGPIY